MFGGEGGVVRVGVVVPNELVIFTQHEYELGSFEGEGRTSLFDVFLRCGVGEMKYLVRVRVRVRWVWVGCS